MNVALFFPADRSYYIHDSSFGLAATHFILYMFIHLYMNTLGIIILIILSAAIIVAFNHGTSAKNSGVGRHYSQQTSEKEPEQTPN
jgi:hypothetical protein